MTTDPLRTMWSKRVMGIVALLATAVAAGLHALFAFSVGALWRDEINSLELATVRTLGEMWTNLDYDSFPALFFFVLRQFAGVPAEISDESLRLFGLAIGLMILGAVWLNARWLRLGVPLISLALIGLNPMVIRYGDSIRAYGLGILLMLLTMGALWKIAETPTARRITIGAIAAVLSVQCLYYNSILLFAIILGAVAVTARRRQWQRVAILLGIGVFSAISLLPYLPTIKRVQAWNFQFKADIDFTFLWGKLRETLGSPISVATWVWVGLLALAGIAAAINLSRTPADEAARARQDRLLFASVTLLIGTLGYAAFLRALSYVTQPWYYILFVAFAAMCLEIIFASLSGRAIVAGARLAFTLAFIGAALNPAVHALQVRQTNVDFITRSLHSLAKKSDLILINTWNYGIAFRRYYHGETPWTTIPPIEDLRFHRCDLAKGQMMSPDPLVAVRQQIADTLRKGNDVWLVGSIDFVPPGKLPLVVPPGYDSQEGWVGGDFYSAWSQQTSYFLQNHVLSFEHVAVPVPYGAVTFESLPLSRFSGFREDGDPGP